MNFPDYPSSGKSPRSQLQGPRPTPLKVRKDSHKIRKPPVVPHHHHHHQSQQQQPPPQHRPPVIIYTVSPKVIHTNPNDFMNLVQRLTGPSSSSSTYSSIPSPAATTSYSAFQDDGGAVSPAARFASIEKIKSPEGRRFPAMQTGDMDMVEGVEISTGLEKSGYFPGILSPGPGSLPPIPPNFFSPSVDPTHLNSFFHDLSPNLHSNRNYYAEGSFMPSPSNLLSSHITSPSSLDLFNNYFDF